MAKSGKPFGGKQAAPFKKGGGRQAVKSAGATKATPMKKPSKKAAAATAKKSARGK